MHDPLRLALQGVRGAVRYSVPLAPLTHIRIGGPAACFVEPYAESDVAQVVRACREEDRQLRILGGGSNVVVSDEGVDAVVMSLGSLNRVVREGTRLTAGAGVSVPTLLRGARELGLAGLECLTGIPAQVGGVVAMNAGTREGETYDHLVSLTVVDRDGEIRVIDRQQFDPTYRDGRLGDWIVVHATFDLREDDPKQIFTRFEHYLKYRNASQPVTERSVGCVFRNPSDRSAGQLIDAAGCKHLRRGGLAVSGKHANYFVNDGEGTYADFLALMEAVRDKVRAEFDVELEPEVKLWSKT